MFPRTIWFIEIAFICAQQVNPVLQRPLVVLSLADGISSLRYVLETELNLKIAAYFSSEICENALAVQRANYGGVLHYQVGDMRLLTDEILSAIKPNLLAAGCPCNEISRVMITEFHIE